MTQLRLFPLTTVVKEPLPDEVLKQAKAILAELLAAVI